MKFHEMCFNHRFNNVPVNMLVVDFSTTLVKNFLECHVEIFQRKHFLTYCLQKNQSNYFQRSVLACKCEVNDQHTLHLTKIDYFQPVLAN